MNVITRKKGQGALEYLIIIAGVLVISALVVYFITVSGGTGAKRNVEAACQNAASQCALKLQMKPDFDCTQMCTDACVDPRTGQDIMADKPAGQQAVDLCKQGKYADITYTYTPGAQTTQQSQQTQS